ncbi:MAG TPA: hypothetical protein VFH33_00920 [Candidatus Krumholzibacteria bacterium]|nr:hypothetical protein [Candidatus Krumholzibacteria bacterium]
MTAATGGKSTLAESSGESKCSPLALIVTDQNGSFPNARYTTAAAGGDDGGVAPEEVSAFFALSPLLHAAINTTRTMVK